MKHCKCCGTHSSESGIIDEEDNLPLCIICAGSVVFNSEGEE